jgi:hypothetical protein
MFEIQDKYDVTFTGEEAFETVGDCETREDFLFSFCREGVC